MHYGFPSERTNPNRHLSAGHSAYEISLYITLLEDVKKEHEEEPKSISTNAIAKSKDCITSINLHAVLPVGVFNFAKAAHRILLSSHSLSSFKCKHNSNASGTSREENKYQPMPVDNVEVMPHVAV